MSLTSQAAATASPHMISMNAAATWLESLANDAQRLACYPHLTTPIYLISAPSSLFSQNTKQTSYPI